MAVVALTQAEKDQLLADPNFRKYYSDNILADTHGGVAYQLGQATFPSTLRARSYVVSLMIRTNQAILDGDTNLANFLMLQMTVRGIDNKDDALALPLLNQVTGYLDLASRIEFLIEDYFTEKSKNW